MAGYGILYNIIMAFWIIVLGQKVLFWSFMGALEAYQLNWHVPIRTVIPLIIFLILLWKKDEKKDGKK